MGFYEVKIACGDHVQPPVTQKQQLKRLSDFHEYQLSDSQNSLRGKINLYPPGQYFLKDLNEIQHSTIMPSSNGKFHTNTYS
jgi:hypothetical protein